MKTHTKYDGITVGQQVHGHCVTVGDQHTGTVKEIRTWPGEEHGARFVVVCDDRRERVLKPVQAA